jgi:hypothetical protein
MGRLEHLLPDTRFQQHKQQQKQQANEPRCDTSTAFSELLLYSAVTQHVQLMTEEQQLQQQVAWRGAAAGRWQVVPTASGASSQEDPLYAGAPSGCWCF